MLDSLRAWLNGTREFNLGVILYYKLGADPVVKSMLSRGKSDYAYERLQTELLIICNELKAKENAKLVTQQPIPEKIKVVQQMPIATPMQEPEVMPHRDPIQEKPGSQNSELFDACKLEADKVYKECMNDRAVLRSLIPSGEYDDKNRQDLVDQRCQLALSVLKLHKEASRLYDRADYVRQNGKLPDDELKEKKPIDVPDHLVKETINNIRKNLSKLKAREKTPARIALIQQHTLDLETLEKRWLSLK